MTAKSPGNFNFSPYLFETMVRYNEKLRNENEKIKKLLRFLAEKVVTFFFMIEKVNLIKFEVRETKTLCGV
jgi:hypothetical protein